MKNKQFIDFFATSPIPVSFHELIVDENGNANDYVYLNVNKAFEKLVAFPRENIVGKSYLEITKEYHDFNNDWYQGFLESMEKKVIKVCDYYLAHNNLWFRGTIFPVDEKHCACLYEDVSYERKEDIYFKGLASINLDLLVVSDMEGYFIKTNEYFENLIGLNFNELINHSFFEFIHEDDLQSTKNAVASLEKGGEVNNFINRYRDKKGTYHFLEWRAKKFGRLVYASARDISKSIETANRLEYEMTIDNLTGLYNRSYFHKRTNEEMLKANANHTPISMIIADIDHFKYVNDTWGHPVGDDVLVVFSRLLGEQIRKSDILSRLGGEEFVVILPNSKSQDAMKVAEKMRLAVANYEFPIISKVTASFGVAQMELNESLRSWYKRTDDAMYIAKSNGRNCVVGSNETVTLETISTSPYFEWVADWESGNGEIDNQHRSIVEMGNSLIFMFQSNVPYEIIIKQVDKIIKHISQHFYYEEKILYNLQFPAYEEHCALHRDIIMKAQELKKRFQDGEVKSIALASFLVDDFIVGHMAKADAKFFYLTKNIN